LALLFLRGPKGALAFGREAGYAQGGSLPWGAHAGIAGQALAHGCRLFLQRQLLRGYYPGI
jgi:hypothetical protein